ncbi:MAG: flagellar hook-length control protein FliK, partial [Pseudonocardiales bacterium]|nr:flagellar hook-length control protein FliK [Pseudonocardiales bacterium]
LPTPATGTPPSDGMLPASPAIATLPGAAAAIARTAGAAKPAEGAKPADVEAADGTAGATNPPGAVPAESGTVASTHGLSHRPARGPAAPGGQAAASADQAAGPAPISSGRPAEPLLAPATAQAGTPSGDLSVQAAQAPVAQPVPAGQPATSGSEPVHRHPTADELPLARQVASPVLALRAGGDGSHQLIVALHPAELGPVNVHVRIAGDLMTIQLASSSESAHDALRDALPQLRSELQSAGLSSATLSLDLTSGDAGGPGAFANPRQDAGEPARAVPADPTPAAPRRSGDRRITPNPSAGLDRWL